MTCFEEEFSADSSIKMHIFKGYADVLSYPILLLKTLINTWKQDAERVRDGTGEL